MNMDLFSLVDIDKALENIQLPAFDMSEFLHTLQTKPLYDDDEYLSQYMLDKHVELVKCWIESNPHHTFPRSRRAWENVLYMHFRYLNIKMDLEGIMNLIKNNEEPKCERIKMLVKRIKKLLKKKTFISPYHRITWRRLEAHCNLYSSPSFEKLYNRMIDHSIVNEAGRLLLRKIEEKDEPQKITLKRGAFCMDESTDNISYEKIKLKKKKI